MRERSRLPKYLLEFANLIQDKLEELLTEWRREVRRLPAAKNLDTPTLDDHIPPLLNEFARRPARGIVKDTFEIVALDGNPVPNPASVPVLWIGTAERVSAIVDPCPLLRGRALPKKHLNAGHNVPFSPQ
jgi:hypothetical protein